MKNDYKKNFKEAVAKLEEDINPFQEIVDNLQQSEFYLQKARGYFKAKNQITEGLINKLDNIDEELLYIINTLGKKYS